MEASYGRDWLRRNLGLVLMGRAMLSKSLIQFSVDGWSYVLSLLFKVKSLSHVDSLRLVDCSPPGSSIHGILQARVLEWAAISFFRRSSQPRDQDQTQVSLIAGRCFKLWATQNMVEVMKIMASFKRSHACTATLTAPSPAAGHHRPTALLETPGHSQASLGHSWQPYFHNKEKLNKT